MTKVVPSPSLKRKVVFLFLILFLPFLMMSIKCEGIEQVVTVLKYQSEYLASWQDFSVSSPSANSHCPCELKN